MLHALLAIETCYQYAQFRLGALARCRATAPQGLATRMEVTAQRHVQESATLFAAAWCSESSSAKAWPQYQPMACTTPGTGAQYTW